MAISWDTQTTMPISGIKWDTGVKVSPEIKKRSNKVSKYLNEYYSEQIDPGIHGLNTMAFGLPRVMLRNINPDIEKAIFAEQTTVPGKIKRGISEGIGFGIGAPAKLALKATSKIGAKGLLGNIARGTVGGAMVGATYTPQEGTDILNLPGRAKQAATFGALGGAMPMAVGGIGAIGTGVKKVGIAFAKDFAGVTQRSLDTMSRLIGKYGPKEGTKFIFDQAKEKSSYIGEALAPETRTKILDRLINYKPQYRRMLSDFGIKNEDIKLFSNLSSEEKTKLGKIFTDTGFSIEDAVRNYKTTVGSGYSALLEKAGSKPINVKSGLYNFYNRMSKLGWMDDFGKPLVEKGEQVGDTLRSSLAKVFEQFKQYGVWSKSGLQELRIPAIELRGLIEQLEAIRGVNPAAQALLIDITKPFRTAAANQVAGLSALNRYWSNILTLEDALPRVQRYLNPQSIQTKLMSLRNPANAIQNTNWRRVMGDELFDKLEAHFALSDLAAVSETPQAGGGFRWTKPSIMKAGFSPLMRFYFSKVYPMGTSVKNFLNQVYIYGGLEAIQKQKVPPNLLNLYK